MNNNPDAAKQRFILMMALGLTFFVILQYIMPPPPPMPDAPRPAAEATAEPRRTSAPQEPLPSVEDFTPGREYAVRVRVGQEGKGENGYEAAFSSVGGSLSSYRLLGHYRVPGIATPENQVVLLDRMAAGYDSLRIDSMTYGATRSELRTLGLRQVQFQLVEAPVGATVEPAPGDDVRRGDNLVFRAIVGEWEIVKIYGFPPAKGGADYTMTMRLEWRNLSNNDLTLTYRVAGPSGMVADDDSPNFGVINFLTARQPSPAATNVEIERKPLSDLVNVTNMMDQDNRANLAWVGTKNRFFVSLMSTDASEITDSNGARRRVFAGELNTAAIPPDVVENLRNQPQVNTTAGPVPVFEDVTLVVEPGTIQPAGRYSASYTLFAGPAVDNLMEAADARFLGVVSYTISYLDFVSRWLVDLLVFLDKILGNYGLAIIAVTLIIKIILHPLNRKSFVSMNKMSKLAPQMKEIQKKYANDKVKLQQEMSKLYKTNGVSMAGGCLPVFLQLPIFFALYGAFSQGFSMRHAAFIPGWINDLSKPDSVYDLGWRIPLLGSSHISLLPILYLGLQFLQMSLQPKPSDPQQQQQQRIMKIMPLMFVFIFYAMPAGLVLYFTVSALCGVAENWWMRKILMPKLGLGDSPEAAQVAAAQTKAGTGGAAVPSSAKKQHKRRR